MHESRQHAKLQIVRKLGVAGWNRGVKLKYAGSRPAASLLRGKENFLSTSSKKLRKFGRIVGEKYAVQIEEHYDRRWARGDR